MAKIIGCGFLRVRAEAAEKLMRVPGHKKNSFGKEIKHEKTRVYDYRLGNFIRLGDGAG